jgi:hypothetical protein
MTKDQIRAVFMANGFTIKEGQTDLKPYVYEAAAGLIRAALMQANADGVRFSAFVSAIVADTNGDELTPSQQAIVDQFQDSPPPRITIDDVRSRIDAALAKEAA